MVEKPKVSKSKHKQIKKTEMDQKRYEEKQDNGPIVADLLLGQYWSWLMTRPIAIWGATKTQANPTHSRLTTITSERYTLRKTNFISMTNSFHLFLLHQSNYYSISFESCTLSIDVVIRSISIARKKLVNRQ